ETYRKLKEKEIHDNSLKPSKVLVDDSQPFRNAPTNINTFKAVNFTRDDGQTLNN
ncbi:4469_t:CDS:2, partial [Gigaspora margarita]